MGSPTKVPFVADLFKSLVLLTNQGQTRALYKLVCGGFGEIARPAGHNQAESYQSSILEAQEGNRGSISKESWVPVVPSRVSVSFTVLLTKAPKTLQSILNGLLSVRPYELVNFLRVWHHVSKANLHGSLQFGRVWWIVASISVSHVRDRVRDAAKWAGLTKAKALLFCDMTQWNRHEQTKLWFHRSTFKGRTTLTCADCIVSDSDILISSMLVGNVMIL